MSIFRAVREPSPEGHDVDYPDAVGPRDDTESGLLPYFHVGRRLKILSVLAPILATVAFEILRYRLEGHGDSFWSGYRLLYLTLTILAILGFAMLMFHFIDRAQRRVQRQNRELTATNALAMAIQGEDGVDRIVDQALSALLEVSGARQVRVTIAAWDGYSHAPADLVRTRRRLGSVVTESPAELTLPLAVGADPIGTMELWSDSRQANRLRLAEQTLRDLGHELAFAVQRAQTVSDLHRRKNEGHAFYAVLLDVSHQQPCAKVLWSVAEHARELVSSDAAVIHIEDDIAHAVHLASGTGEAESLRPGHQSFSSGIDWQATKDGHQLTTHPIGSEEWRSSTSVPVRGAMGVLGELWVGRRSGVEFTDRDRGFLETLAGLAGIAVTNAQIQESGRQNAVLAERTRLAREMHDSLAQVLGAAHLRLRAFEGRPELEGTGSIPEELGKLADLCEEGYNDVRDVILGLRHSDTQSRSLESNLRLYLERYAQQFDIKTRLTTDLDHELSLSPRCEVHLIRVVQEALTNVRKHADASSAQVWIGETDTGTVVVVEDNGIGFDLASLEGDGYGLYSMRERLQLLSGTLTVDSAPGRGTRVIASVPEHSRAYDRGKAT